MVAGSWEEHSGQRTSSPLVLLLHTAGHVGGDRVRSWPRNHEEGWGRGARDQMWRTTTKSTPNPHPSLLCRNMATARMDRRGSASEHDGGGALTSGSTLLPRHIRAVMPSSSRSISSDVLIRPKLGETPLPHSCSRLICCCRSGFFYASSACIYPEFK